MTLRPEEVLAAVLVFVSSLGMFIFLSSAIAAILFGNARAPAFIRSASWLYSRPTSPLEWFGLAIAIAIAFASQWVVTQSISTDARTFGPLGLAILWAELVAAGGWLVYLSYRYLRGP